MVRIFMGSLAFALVVVLATACGGEKSAPKPKAGEPAGLVIELTGSVRAEHAGNERALKVGDKVMADDTIVTGEKASVTIRLFHNEARWELGANKRRAVRKSLAWNAPKGSGAGGAGASDKTMAAGRHAERQAGTTTAVRPTAKKSPDPNMVKAKTEDRSDRSGSAETKPPVPKSKPAVDRPKLRVRVRRRARRRITGSRATRPPPPPIRIKLNKSLGDLLRGGGERHGSGSGLRGPGPGNSGSLRGKGGSGGRINTRSLTSKKLGKKGGRRGRVYLEMTISGSVSKNAVRRVFRRYTGLFRACYARGLTKNRRLAGKLRLTLNVAQLGKVVLVKIGGQSALKKSIGKCIARRAYRLRFPSTTKRGAYVIQVLRFSL